MIGMHDLKIGAAVIVDGQPYFIVDFKRAGTGQRRPVLHVKLRHIVTGSQTEKTLAEKDMLEEANVERSVVTFSYRRGTTLVFMDQKTYAEVELSADLVGKDADLLDENVEVRVMSLDGNPIGIELPASVTLEVVETPDTQKGAPSSRSSSVGKPAKLANGTELEVPLFIKRGDRIRIDTATRQYQGKANE